MTVQYIDSLFNHIKSAMSNNLATLFLLVPRIFKKVVRNESAR